MVKHMNELIYPQVIKSKLNNCPVEGCKTLFAEKECVVALSGKNGIGAKVKILYCSKCDYYYIKHEHQEYIKSITGVCAKCKPNPMGINGVKTANKKVTVVKPIPLPKKVPLPQRRIVWKPIIGADTGNRRQYPKSIFATVIMKGSNSNKDLTYEVVTDINEEDKDKRIFHIENSFTMNIFKAIVRRTFTFSDNGVDYTITYCHRSDNVLQYMKSIEAEKSKNKHSNNDLINEIIYLCQGHISCYWNSNHKLESVTANVLSLDNLIFVKINVKYCTRCNKYFIHDKTYDNYARMYGDFVLRPIRITENYKYHDEDSYRNLNPKSLLAMYGYKAGFDTSDEWRQKKLVSIIELGLMRKEDIIGHLESLSRLQANNENHIWSNKNRDKDLGFLNDYDIEKQREIFGVIVENAKHIRIKMEG